MNVGAGSTSTTNCLEGTTSSITDVQSLDMHTCENLPNNGTTHPNYLDGDEVTARWETHQDIE